MDVTVQLPHKLYEQMRGVNDSGKIEFKSQEAKQMKSETDSGKIVMKSLLASILKAKSDNGCITVATAVLQEA